MGWPALLNAPSTHALGSELRVQLASSAWTSGVLRPAWAGTQAEVTHVALFVKMTH